MGVRPGVNESLDRYMPFTPGDSTQKPYSSGWSIREKLDQTIQSLRNTLKF